MPGLTRRWTPRRLSVRTLALTLMAVGVTAACGTARDAVPQRLDTVTEGVLTVAAVVPSPGFWEGEDPAAPTAGFEWDLAHTLAERFDLALRIEPRPLGALLAGDLDGVDLALAQIEPTPERAAVMAFSLPYLEADLGVLVRAGDEIRDLASSRESSWAVVADTRGAMVMADTVRASEVTVVGGELEAADEVRTGRVDAALIDLSTALVIAGGDPDLHVTARFVTGGTYALALPRASANRELLDAAVRALERDGTLQRLEAEWLDPLYERPVAEVPVIRSR